MRGGGRRGRVSKLETPMIRRYWEQVGGTLIEEFMAVPRKPGQGRRMIDGIIVLGGPRKIATSSEVDIAGKDIIVIQAKAQRLGMYLMGQAVFSPELMKPFKPASIRSVALCSETDSVLEPLLAPFGVEVIVGIGKPSAAGWGLPHGSSPC
jgi:hypothetical protein